LNTRNFDALRDLLAPDFVRHCQAMPDVVIKNRDQFIEYLKMDDAVFPNSRQTAEHVVAEGDFVAFWLKYEGTQKGQMGPFPPSHRRMLLDVGGIFRVHDGKLAELWITWGNLASLTQLGHLPPRSP
jgi:predicted ester cyclase